MALSKEESTKQNPGLTIAPLGVALAAKASVFTLLIMPMATTAAKAQNEWQDNIDWAASNTDAGGSVDCPANYISEGVAYAIASGGRAAAINAALFAAANQDFARAYRLVLMTQCHNADARQTLINAGQSAVLLYLLNNFTPNGPDPDVIIGAVKTAIQILSTQ